MAWLCKRRCPAFDWRSSRDARGAVVPATWSSCIAFFTVSAVIPRLPGFFAARSQVNRAFPGVASASVPELSFVFWVTTAGS